MSMADDYEVGYDPYEDECDDIFRQYLTGTLSWTTRDLEVVPVVAMTSSHIRACLGMRSFANMDNWRIVFNFELARRENN